MTIAGPHDREAPPLLRSPTRGAAPQRSALAAEITDVFLASDASHFITGQLLLSTAV